MIDLMTLLGRSPVGLRDLGESVLHAYGAISDRKDLDEALRLFDGAVVTFPHRSARTPADRRELYSALWSTPVAHRHVMTNVQVTGEEQRAVVTALYTRWVFDPEAVMTTMGEYELVLARSGESIAVEQLTVTRTWQAAS